MRNKYVRLTLLSVCFFILGVATARILNPYPPLRCENSYKNNDKYIAALEQWLIVFYKENPGATNIDALALRDAHFKKIGCIEKVD